MGKKLFIYGFFFFVILSLVLSFCTRAEAAEYSVYTDSSIDSNVLDSVMEVTQSSFSAVARAPAKKNRGCTPLIMQ